MTDFIEHDRKPTKKIHTASHHPAKTTVKPARKPVDGEGGFSGHVYEQRKKTWEERDNPERKDAIKE